MIACLSEYDMIYSWLKARSEHTNGFNKKKETKITSSIEKVKSTQTLFLCGASQKKKKIPI